MCTNRAYRRNDRGYLKRHVDLVSNEGGRALLMPLLEQRMMKYKENLKEMILLAEGQDLDEE